MVQILTSIIEDTVARLATVDSECKPHLIPVVFVFDNDCYFIPIDESTLNLRSSFWFCDDINTCDKNMIHSTFRGYL
jgi:hypothetical protein